MPSNLTASVDPAPISALLDGARLLAADAPNPQNAKRIEASVIRPLEKWLVNAGTEITAVAPPAAATFDGASWELTRVATALCASPSCPNEVLEATAALQDITFRFHDGALAAQARALVAHRLPAIRLEAAGPLLVSNVETLSDWLGNAIPATPIMALCRCGQSAMKPFCDGAHATGFDDAKDPKRVPDRQDEYAGVQITVLDNRGTCQHSGYCTDRLPTVFRANKEPFVAPSGGRMDEIIRAVRDCPSGALSYAIDGIEEREDVDYHGTRPAAIVVSKDGPYRVTGGVPIENPDGSPAARNAGASSEHCALCRCGHAQNKPFCTGMHWYVNFHDPLAEKDETPTIFEWAGGLPAFTRMTRLFYEKFVPNDDLLAPIFAEMSPDHPERVAKWLAEVFSGPKHYSVEYGGYTRMLSQHLGKGLTEEMRVRWATLLLQAAREAGLPNDAEFRAAFQSYIEWGSRLAVENSQQNSKPPEHMPMPHWDWHTSAGPPGSRVSGLATLGSEPEPPPILPAAGEPVTFANVKGLFRASDRQSMQFAFDLWKFEDVSTHADVILERVSNGSMPCDGAWPKERVDVFARWIETGKLQ
jgi:CDGSH-type Zn-finger protein/truncated hemoglobin YjbI/ferredoxin